MSTTSPLPVHDSPLPPLPPMPASGDPRTPGARWVRRGRLLTLAFLLAGVALDPAALIAIPAFFLLVAPLERLFPRHRQRVRRPQLGTDLAYAVSQPVIAAVGMAVGVAVGLLSLAWLPGLLLRPLVDLLPSGVRTLLGVLLFDAVVYWVHRWSHEVPLLWRFHAVHHSTESLDWVSGFRNHPVDGLAAGPPVVLLLAAGFDPALTGVLALVQGVLGLLLHANVRWRLRPLQRLLVTPEFHHWHHADEADAHNSNYSVFLPIWDMVFGTWFMPEDRRPTVYGIAESMPAGIAEQMLWPFRGMPPLGVLVRHPLCTLAAIWSGAREVVAQIWAVTTGRRAVDPPVRA